ncbi:MAG: hypothetical protein U5N58_14155 [Actinomycetota bacterium]|nr:hypothetical protein [Actinomycetota bacterium]
MLKSWPDRDFKAAYGLAGTITTLAGIDMELEVYDREEFIITCLAMTG